jgi:hypothetical protein
MFAPITPAVITRHPAAIVNPAASSWTSTIHHRQSSSRLRVAHAREHKYSSAADHALAPSDPRPPANK